MRSLVFVMAMIMALPLAAQEAPRRIVVTGEGRVEAAPDMATITLGVLSEGARAADALAANNTALAAVLEELTAAGIAARDVQTTGLSLNPRWTRSTSGSSEAPRIAGFTATNTVTVRVRDLSALGGILDTVVQSGANNFHGLQFGLQDPAPLMEEARKRAVADAMAKAGTLSTAAGVTLGPVMMISESGGAQPRPVMMRMESAMVADAVPVAEGEVSLSVYVNMEFAID